MKKSIKRGLAVLTASAVAFCTFSVSSIVRSNAADINRDNIAKYIRDTNLAADSKGELVVTRNENGNTQMGKEDSWTIFVYMCGSDLESYYGLASMDIAEMIEAAESDNVNVVIQTGGARTWRGSYGVSSTQLGRYIVKNDKLELVEKLPAANMGKGDTLEDFLKWGVENYAAEHMGVVYWNHGGGSITGVCFDERNSYDSLSLGELEKAMGSVSENMTDKFDFIGFDACLMASIETANVLAPYAEYMIASEETEPGYGWDYTPFVNTMVQNSDVDTETLGKVIVDSYYNSLVQINQQSASTLSVFDLSKLDNVLVEFNKFAKKMTESVNAVSDVTNFTRIAKASDNYGGNNAYEGYTNMVDLGDFVKGASSYVDGTDTLKAINDMIVYMKNGTTYSNSTGVSFYYPLAVAGMGEMNILRNIAVSPYYMNYLDKVLYASKKSTLNGFTSNEWENSKYYFDTDYEFLDYEFSSFSDYKSKYMNKPYFREAEFDDNWYDWYTNKTTTSSSTVTIDPELSEWLDGLKVVSKGNGDTVVEASAQVAVDNGNGVSVLGSIGEAGTDISFDGKWFALADGQYLAAELIAEKNSLSLYTAPAIVDGKEVAIRFVADSDKNTFVLGAWDGISEQGQAGKGLRTITAGSKITPVYTSLNVATNEVNTVYGSEFVVTDQVIVNKNVENSAYVLRVIDTFGNTTFSTPIVK